MASSSENARTSLAEQVRNRSGRARRQLQRWLSTKGGRKAVNRLRRSFEVTFTEGEAPPVFVYQMAKVGSKSVERAVKARWPGPVLHGHALYRFRPLHLDVSALYWNYFAERAAGATRPLYVVSLVREPISKNVSHYFQKHNNDEALFSRDVAFLEKHFLSHFNHSLALRWFDKFFRPYTGIDVYATPFPEAGYATYERGNCRVLVLRVEMPDEEKDAALSDFLGVEGISVAAANVAGEKWFGDTYARFKEHFRPPAWYVEMMHDAKYTTHFYGDEKGRVLRSRWADRAVQTDERRPWI